MISPGGGTCCFLQRGKFKVKVLSRGSLNVQLFVQPQAIDRVTWKPCVTYPLKWADTALFLAAPSTERIGEASKLYVPHLNLPQQLQWPSDTGEAKLCSLFTADCRTACTLHWQHLRVDRGGHEYPRTLVGTPMSSFLPFFTTNCPKSDFIFAFRELGFL